MPGSVVFIFSAAYWHLVKTLLLARFYADKGYIVQYAIFGENQALEPLLPGTIRRMKAPPFGLTHEAYDDSQPPVRLSWWKEVLARHSGVHYHRRKAEVEQLISDLDPSIIFLDEFCVTDFIILYPHLSGRRCIVLSTYLPLLTSKRIPPFHLFALPGNSAQVLWKKYLRLRLYKRLKNTLKFFGADHSGIVNKRFKQQRIPAPYQPVFRLEKVPFFANMEKWYTLPHEIDFDLQPLPAGHHYMGPMLAMDRQETYSPQYQLFLRLAARAPGNKLIFCSLGTVMNGLLSDLSVLIDFYTRLLQIAQSCPELYFLVKTDQRVADNLKTCTMNCMFTAFAPQLDVLKRADVFITHAGGNSVLEAIWMATPMLTVPPVTRWDYNGHAARIVYHQLGLKTDLTVASQPLQEAIYELIQNDLYRTKIREMSQVFQTKYHPNYLHELPMPLP